MAPTADDEKSWAVAKTNDNKWGILAKNWFLDGKKRCKYPIKINAFLLNSWTENCVDQTNCKGGEWKEFDVVKIYKDDITDFAEAKQLLMTVDSEASEVENEDVPHASKAPPKHLLPDFPSHKTKNSMQSPDGTVTKENEVSKSPHTDKSEHVNGDASQNSKANLEVEVSKSSHTDKSEHVNGNASQNSKADLEVEDFVHNLETNALSSGDISVLSVDVDRSPDSAWFKRLLVVELANNKLLKTINEKLTDNGPKANANSSGHQIENNMDDEFESENKILSVCPLKTLNDFKTFDEKLKTSKIMRRKLRDELESHVTKDRMTSCRALALTVMDNEVAKHYTFKGRKTSNQKIEKHSFMDTKLYDIIFQTVSKVFPARQGPEPVPKFTVQDYQKNLSEWFSQASFRIQYKKERAQKRVEKELIKEAEVLEKSRILASSSSDDSDVPNKQEPKRKKSRKTNEKGSCSKSPDQL